MVRQYELKESCRRQLLPTRRGAAARPSAHMRLDLATHAFPSGACTGCSVDGSTVSGVFLGCTHRPGSIGSENQNVEPSPSRESIWMRPPCNSIIRFEIASPSPVPPFLRVIEL